MIKIQSIRSFYTKDRTYIPFCKGQEFFLLYANYSSEEFFVSTVQHLPFSENAFNGLVPMDCFSPLTNRQKGVTEKERLEKERIARRKLESMNMVTRRASKRRRELRQSLASGIEAVLMHNSSHPSFKECRSRKGSGFAKPGQLVVSAPA